jgi:anti-sigma factor RsiW
MSSTTCLPGYFSGDISPATRALVDEFLEQDPEFRRMMERFRTMFGDARGGMAHG